MSEETDEERAAREAREDVGRRFGEAAGERLGKLARYDWIFQVLGGAVILARLMGWLPVSWLVAIALALVVAFLPSALYAAGVGMLVARKLKREAEDEAAAERR